MIAPPMIPRPAQDPRERLRQLALNLWWTWQPDVIEVFRAIDPDVWRRVHHNPLALLDEISDADLQSAVRERGLRSRIDFHFNRLQEHFTTDDTWCAAHGGSLATSTVAYFSAEFGLHESLPLYSGGLGILAGDHLKSASDLGVPIVGVGLLYASGHFNQRLDAQGWQHEEYGRTPVHGLPIVPAVDAAGRPLLVKMPCGDRQLGATVWLAHVGRARLLLLDTDVDANPPDFRELTSRLYGGDEVTRIRQEILLGIGGLRALRALNIRPAVLHLNEGHSAFAILERVRQRVEDDGLSFDDGWRLTTAETVFTTHTPVEAGHDRFAPDLVLGHLKWLLPALGIDAARLLSTGRVDPNDAAERFTMTVLGLKGAGRRNGVSSLHGRVARGMWRRVWPQKDEASTPIGHITNGVHVPCWIAPAIARVYARWLGGDWLDHHGNRDRWAAVDRIDPGELWEAHLAHRRALIDFVRRRAQNDRILDPDALTIGFARRFAAYKRATLVLSDPARLNALLTGTDGPVQVVFAGKAHPRDDGGKHLIQDIVALARDRRFAGRIAFIEDYDINVARHMVQGVDVWLNTPLRPFEASGTSGQKAAINGALNLSVLDGWWAEAFDGSNGFAIGDGRTHSNADIQWQRDAASLYDVLERQVVPMFADRDAAGLPQRWIARMKRSIRTLGWRFSADRMVQDYARHCYLPACGGLSADFGA